MFNFLKTKNLRLSPGFTWNPPFQRMSPPHFFNFLEKVSLPEQLCFSVPGVPVHSSVAMRQGFGSQGSANRGKERN